MWTHTFPQESSEASFPPPQMSSSDLPRTADYIGEFDGSETNPKKYTSEAYLDTGHHSPPVYPLSTYKLQNDPNPVVIRKPAQQSAMSMKQNVLVRYFRPPPLPAPGPLVIREVRPPQIPPAPPLIVRQRPPQPPSLPPIILRERPPKQPLIDLKPRMIIKRVPALPPPPRQVIVERYPPLPPKPRDIIIERWLPYPPLQKRKVVYQKAVGVPEYKAKKNIIIQYESARVTVQRVFRKEDVIQADPEIYASRYGHSLLDSVSLEHSARQVGVVEDIGTHGQIEIEQSHQTHPYESLNQCRSSQPEIEIPIEEQQYRDAFFKTRGSPFESEVLVNDAEFEDLPGKEYQSGRANSSAGFDSGIYIPDFDYRAPPTWITNEEETVSGPFDRAENSTEQFYQ